MVKSQCFFPALTSLNMKTKSQKRETGVMELDGRRSEEECLWYHSGSWVPGVLASHLTWVL